MMNKIIYPQNIYSALYPNNSVPKNKSFPAINNNEYEFEQLSGKLFESVYNKKVKGNFEKNLSQTEFLKPDFEYIKSLSEEEQFLLCQYSSHGDIIINNLLRGSDLISQYPINIYVNNIFNPELFQIDGISSNIHFCLYWYEIDRLLKDEKENSYELFINKVGNSFKINKETDNRINLMKKNYEVSNAMFKHYIDEIFPRIKKLYLDELRRITYKIILKLCNVFYRFPGRENNIIVYRGVMNWYMKVPAITFSIKEMIESTKQIYVMNTFYSTTINRLKTPRFFGRNVKDPKIYKFILHPNAKTLYIKNVSYSSNEEEILIAPGNKYIYVGREQIAVGQYGNINTQIFFVLPPEEGFSLPATYEEYVTEYLPKKGGKRKTRKQKIKVRKTRKQFGGMIDLDSETPMVRTIPITQKDIEEIKKYLII